MTREEIYRPIRGMRVTEDDGKAYVHDGAQWLTEQEFDAAVSGKGKKR